jgi:predicted component of type VI protein secretion system
VAKLLFVDQGISTEFLLDDSAGEISLGRSPSCTVRVNNPSLSRVHAVLVREGSPARYRVMDRGSSNGTYVNGQRQDEALLRHGDQLMCGEFVFLFVDDAGAIGGVESRSMPPMPSPMPPQVRMALEATAQASGASEEGAAAPAAGTRSLRPLSTDAQIAQVTEDGFYAALEQASLRVEVCSNVCLPESLLVHVLECLKDLLLFAVHCKQGVVSVIKQVNDPWVGDGSSPRLTNDTLRKGLP